MYGNVYDRMSLLSFRHVCPDLCPLVVDTLSLTQCADVCASDLSFGGSCSRSSLVCDQACAVVYPDGCREYAGTSSLRGNFDDSLARSRTTLVLDELVGPFCFKIPKSMRSTHVMPVANEKSFAGRL